MSTNDIASFQLQRSMWIRINGLDIATAVYATVETKYMLVALTERTEAIYRDICESLGFDDFLSKPV